MIQFIEEKLKRVIEGSNYILDTLLKNLSSSFIFHRLTPMSNFAWCWWGGVACLKYSTTLRPCITPMAHIMNVLLRPFVNAGDNKCHTITSQIARFVWPTRGPPGAATLAPWCLLSEVLSWFLLVDGIIQTDYPGRPFVLLLRCKL